MSVVSTHASLSGNTKKLSNVEFKIKTTQDEMLAITREAQGSMGDQGKLQQLHNKNVQLEMKLKKLQLEYEALKGRVEQDQKMQKDSIKRAFSSTI